MLARTIRQLQIPLVSELLHNLDYQQLSITAFGLATLAMAFSPRIKREVRDLQEGKCHACGCVPCDCLQIHHRLPQALGGTDGIDNAVGLCGEKDNGCHQEADRLAFEEGIIYPQVHSRNRS